MKVIKIEPDLPGNVEPEEADDGEEEGIAAVSDNAQPDVVLVGESLARKAKGRRAGRIWRHFTEIDSTGTGTCTCNCPLF